MYKKQQKGKAHCRRNKHADVAATAFSQRARGLFSLSAERTPSILGLGFYVYTTTHIVHACNNNVAHSTTTLVRYYPMREACFPPLLCVSSSCCFERGGISFPGCERWRWRSERECNNFSSPHHTAFAVRVCVRTRFRHQAIYLETASSRRRPPLEKE